MHWIATAPSRDTYVKSWTILSATKRETEPHFAPSTGLFTTAEEVRRWWK